MITRFVEKLAAAWRANDSMICLGLDPDLSRLPAHLPKNGEGILAFNRAIVDATHDLVCAYKPQIAYFAARGAEDALVATIAYIREYYPAIPVILDAKRGDIGSTAEQYAVEVFDRFGADAVTINPYLGRDAAEPFLRRADKGVVVLCRTSNPGAADFQDLLVNGRPLYEIVAETVARQWNAQGNCLLVVGATWPEQIARVRACVGDMPLLVPGVGTQGGEVEKLVLAGRVGPEGRGLIISSSRSVLYALGGDDFAAAARAEVQRLRVLVNACR